MKVLMAYSSGFGTTKEIAEKLADILAEPEKIKVEILPIDQIGDLKEFDAIVVGTSVRADRPTANVRDFFTIHHRELIDKKVALFVVCLSANCREGREKVKHEAIQQIIEKYPDIQPLSIEAFGGRIDFDRLNPVMQSLMKKVLLKSGLPDQGSIDTRDWAFIAQWGEALKAKLLQETAHP
ncbi:MAG TPA: flavodoxin domain-containing protein [bacterium]|jgi:menaquinone-dependent protoporphyrinogen oxidase|nr:flavodoxin domain-containing protein [bacterium]HNT64734.1 flavodoxin domain-containing protein [bacterium]HOX85895.1 flavodoxin domain-containing protein [bacterium]HPG45122.1 flavodoxin domain-containing protein [bacterium]HPM97364.1 flavodoxin domain-containing protein [bacterium]